MKLLLDTVEVIVTPTRELADQIYHEARKFSAGSTLKARLAVDIDVEGGEIGTGTEDPGADPRVEVKNVCDDEVRPTGACREEEDPGPGLGPEMFSTSILWAAAGPPWTTPPPHCTVHFLQDLNLQ